MERTKKFTLATKDGCKRLLALFLVVILSCSFLGALISSNFGKVKVTTVKFDARGAAIDADLYVPLGVSDSDKLPAVITIHGGGVVKGVMKPFAEELSRRGFVVLNFNAYGQGLSEQPISDDAGQGANGYDARAFPLNGALDVVDYLRSLHYVDTNRIGIAGHSMGSRRAGLAAIYDCGYLNLNDILINTMCDTFNVKITAEEVNTPAEQLAAKYLDKAQLAHFEHLKEEATEYYNSRVKSICLLGSNANLVNPIQPVTVGGHEVERNCQVNIGVITGSYDTGYWAFNKEENTKKAWFTGGKDAEMSKWYLLDDANASSVVGGDFDTLSVLNDSAFSQAVENRSVRMWKLNPETHSKNFFSVKTTADTVKYFEQTLKFNGGDLGAAGTHPIPASSSIWFFRSVLNCIAMFAMIALTFPLVGLLTKGEYFAACIAPEPAKRGFNPKTFWLFSVLTVAFTFISIYIANAKGMAFFPTTKFWPLSSTSGIALLFVGFLAISSAIMLLIYTFLANRSGEKNCFSGLNVKIGTTPVLKSLLMSLIILAIMYGSLLVIEYLFFQDYRFWMMSFSDMQVVHWAVALRYAIYFLPIFLLTGATTNYAVRSDIPMWKDTLITVVVGSLGVWACCLINILLAMTSFNGTLFSSFICSYSMLFFVPTTVYISRKTYNLTHSIWLGAFMNTFILAWSIVSANGLADGYYGQTIFNAIFGV